MIQTNPRQQILSAAKNPKSLKEVILNFVLNEERYQLMHAEAIEYNKVVDLIALVAKPKLNSADELIEIEFALLSETGSCPIQLNEVEIKRDDVKDRYEFIIEPKMVENRTPQVPPKSQKCDDLSKMRWFEKKEIFDIKFILPPGFATVKFSSFINPTLGKICVGVPIVNK